MQQQMYVKAMQAQREREIAAAIRDRGLPRSSQSVRRAVGLSIMKVGARLAAEPKPRLARSA
jgi:hypothetical protein